MNEIEHAYDTQPVAVWVDVDRMIAPLVRTLNIIPGVRTFASCGGHPWSAADTRAYVLIGHEHPAGLGALGARIHALCLPGVSITWLNGSAEVRLPPDVIPRLCALLAGDNGGVA